jgi:hypothetical protein
MNKATPMKPNILLHALLVAALLGACGSDDADDSQATTDAGSADTSGSSDTQPSEDVATIGDVSAPPDANDNSCPQVELIEAWPFNDEFAQGDVDTSADGAVFISEINAFAGGSQGARDNAFIYFDFVTAEQQLLTDDESLIDADWVLAFRRTNIRLNSADSGPGGWEMAKLSGTTLDAVDAAPTAANAWKTDTTFSSMCEILLDPINNPMTAINFLNLLNPSGSSSWYSYSDSGVAAIEGDVYVVRNVERDLAFKFEIQGWNDGIYTLRWAQLTL